MLRLRLSPQPRRLSRRSTADRIVNVKIGGRITSAGSACVPRGTDGHSGPAALLRIADCAAGWIVSECRSEERRGGKEGRSRRSPDHCKKKPAYEMPKCLEFRRVLFRSPRGTDGHSGPAALLRIADCAAVWIVSEC